jgi:hypothetical protein
MRSEQEDSRMTDESCKAGSATGQMELPKLQAQSTNDTTGLDGEKILRRKRRKELFLTGLIILAIAVGILVVLYVFLRLTGTSSMARGNDTYNAIEMSVGFTKPGVRLAGGGSNIALLGNVSVKFDLTKQIGDRNGKVGTISGTTGLFGQSLFDYQWNREYTQYAFQLPGYQSLGSTARDAEFWQRLELLPPGTAAEMAFSLDRYYDIDKIPQFPGEDLTISWCALDTGERLGPDQNPGGVVGAPLGIDYYYWSYKTTDTMGGESFPFGPTDWLRGTTRTATIHPLPQDYVDKIAWLSQHPAIFNAVAPDVQHEIPIQQRYQYLKEHGLKVYGIVVQGPVKELLALKNIPQLHDPELGAVDWWLPSNPDISGD